MCGEFAAGIYAVVTARAVASNTSVVKLRRAPGAGGVARVTGLSSGDMRRMLARGLGAVVAGATAGSDALMAELRWRPAGRAMAQFAALRRR